jgi:hypothetical protein
MPLTKEDLNGLARFARLPEGQLFVGLLEKRLAEHDKTLRTARGEDIFRAQGAAQAVEQIIKDITQAPTNLQRITGSAHRIPA